MAKRKRRSAIQTAYVDRRRGRWLPNLESYMNHEPTSTTRARRLRERRARGIVMVAPVEIGEGGVELLVGNGLLKQHQTRDRNSVGAACAMALRLWSQGQGARSTGQG